MGGWVQGDGVPGGCTEQGEAKHRKLSPAGGDLTQAGGLGLPIIVGPSRTGGKPQTWKGNGSSLYTLPLLCSYQKLPSLLLTSTAHLVNKHRIYSLQTFSGRLFGIMPKNRTLGLDSGFDIY